MSVWDRNLISDQSAKDWLQIVSNPFYEFAACSLPSPGRETDNEDAVCLLSSKNSAACFVADGLGGQKGGADASKLLLQNISQKLLPTKDFRSSSRNQTLDLIEQTNDEIISWGFGAGTTCAGVLLEKQYLRSFTVGDSKIFLVGQKGKHKFESTSHSPVGYAFEAGLLTNEEAIKHPDAHIVLNSLGSPEMFIELGPWIEMSAADTLLICSDGLTDNLRLDEIFEKIRKGPLEGALQSLVNMTQERMSQKEGKEDDLSLVLVRLASQN